MCKKPFLIIVCTLIVTTGIAQYNYVVNGSSKTYNAKLNVETCDNEACNGKGTIKLFKKGSIKLVQELKSDDLNFTINNKTSAKMELSNEESPLIFADFNFDGAEDLAIKNGKNSGYGGASYDVYVYSTTKNKFMFSKELTALASTNLGMFEVDNKKKLLITFTKSGCCWHQSAQYAVIQKQGLVKVSEKTEDATKGDEYVYVTDKKLVKGKWTKSTKKHMIKDYYKQ